MTYYISCLNRDGLYKEYEVPEEVYLYVRQLECYVKYPEESKLKTVYCERFKEDHEGEGIKESIKDPNLDKHYYVVGFENNSLTLAIFEEYANASHFYDKFLKKFPDCKIYIKEGVFLG